MLFLAMPTAAIVLILSLCTGASQDNEYGRRFSAAHVCGEAFFFFKSISFYLKKVIMLNKTSPQPGGGGL